jgi:flavin-dependent dehydrogenase
VELDQRIELHTVSDAYCGVVTLEDNVVNLCCLARTDALRRAGGTLDRFYASILMENPYLHARMRGAKRLGPRWTTVGFTYANRPMPVENELWRVGDSSAMIAPLTGDGMGMAVCTAELAAATALAAFRGDLVWERATAEYARRWHREFASRLRWGRRLEAILLSPRLVTLACRLLGIMPSLINVVYRRTRRWSGRELQGRRDDATPLQHTGGR